MSTRSVESRSNSPEGGEPEKRPSKKRKVLSCYACRNRKMKCDRIYPVCGRCQRTGRADSCTYDPRLLEELPVNGDGTVDTAGATGSHFQHPDAGGPLATAQSPSDALTWKLRMQERKLDMMEKRLARMDGIRSNSSLAFPPSRYDEYQEEDEPKVSESIMFRGRSFKTLFYGSTSPLSLLNQFPELQTFTRMAFSSDLSMGRIRSDFRAFRSRRKALVKEQVQTVQGTDAEVFALIPEKSAVDTDVALYFQTIENSYRILHKPSFYQEYDDFWQKPDKASPSFASILVLMMATVRCLAANHETVFIGDSSSERETASKWIDVCDAWLDRQNRKHLTLAFFQLQCLSLLAKRVNCIMMKQDWVQSGDMLRLAISAGLHRNSDLLGGRITEFEKEMRRRIWATMMELELQASIDMGLPSSLCGFYFDTQPPANINDDAFGPESENQPLSRPIDYFTSTSYLQYTVKSIPLRVHLMHLLNNPTTNLQYSDVLHYDTQIASILSSLPTWDSPHAAVPHALLDLQLRQFQLILHFPYAKLAHTNPRFSFSLTAITDAANCVLNLHHSLLNSDHSLLNHLRNDTFRTAMAISQAVYHNSVFPPDPPATNGTGPTSVTSTPQKESKELVIPTMPTNNLLISSLSTTCLHLLDLALQIFESKVMRMGTGYMEYWIMSAAIGVMPSSPSSHHGSTRTSSPVHTHYSSVSMNGSYSSSGADDIKVRGRKAIDKITRLCFKILALQKDSTTEFASSLRHTMSTASPPAPSEPDLPNPPSQVPNLPMKNPGATQDLPLIGVPGVPGGMPLATAMAGALGGINGVNGVPLDTAFAGLQDMDVNGWGFPDFWSFDMGGDF